MPDHFINSIKLDFSFNEKEKENALSKSRQIFEEKILPKLNVEFDKIVEDIYIEHLEIFIGETTESDFALQFEKAFMESWARRSIRLPEKTVTPSPVSPIQTDPFIFFLEKGYWPWNYQSKDPGILFGYIKEVFLNTQRSRVLFDWIRVQATYVQARLVDMVNQRVDVAEKFYRALLMYHPALELSRPLKLFFESSPGFVREAGRNFVILSLLSAKPLESARKLRAWLRNLELKLVENIWPAGSTLRQIQHELLAGSGRPDDLVEIENLWQRIEKLINQVEDSSFSMKDEQVSDNLSILYQTEGRDKIAIDNAGLVLLHPFLPYVFKELRWTNSNNMFEDARNQQKAILFLQYLVNRRSRQPEHTLALNKILCGWPLHLPLNIRANFSAAEKNAATDLIDSLREHWKPVKNTTRQGLVQSFILRKGLLETGERDYLLQVEKNTIDILLEDLPFGIQTIKLPWNEKLIHCEWSY